MAKGKEDIDVKNGFLDVYSEICYRHNTCPQKFAKHFLESGVLNVKADRVKSDDWLPLLETIQDNHTLKCITIRNSYSVNLNFKGNLENQKERLKLIPAINKREIIRKIVATLKIVLKSSKILECLILENVSLNEEDVKIISQGLFENKNLKYISFENCRLGNKNFQLICNSIKNSLSLLCINFSNCNLTWSAMEKLKKLIEHQSVVRHGNMWEKSLRYQRPDLNQLNGLQEIILNRNPAIGDKGVEILIEALKEDLWIREIHLQHCGLTDDGGKLILKLLETNSCLSLINTQDNSFQDENIDAQLSAKCKLKEKWEERYFPSEPANKTKFPLPAFKTGCYKKSSPNGPRQSPTNRSLKILEKQNEELKMRVAQLSSQLEKETNNHLETKKKLTQLQDDVNKLKSDNTNGHLNTFDDSFLVAIETTFKRFQEFINLIKKSELKNLINIPDNLLDLAQTTEKINRETSIKRSELNNSGDHALNNKWAPLKRQEIGLKPNWNSISHQFLPDHSQNIGQSSSSSRTLLDYFSNDEF